MTGYRQCGSQNHVLTPKKLRQHKWSLKVKEPIACEYAYLRPDLLLFTYLHLASNRASTDALLAAKTAAIA
jgi:alanine dehydrogenase